MIAQKKSYCESDFEPCFCGTVDRFIFCNPQETCALTYDSGHICLSNEKIIEENETCQDEFCLCGSKSKHSVSGLAFAICAGKGAVCRKDVVDRTFFCGLPESVTTDNDKSFECVANDFRPNAAGSLAVNGPKRTCQKGEYCVVNAFGAGCYTSNKGGFTYNKGVLLPGTTQECFEVIDGKLKTKACPKDLECGITFDGVAVCTDADYKHPAIFIGTRCMGKHGCICFTEKLTNYELIRTGHVCATLDNQAIPYPRDYFDYWQCNQKGECNCQRFLGYSEEYHFCKKEEESSYGDYIENIEPLVTPTRVLTDRIIRESIASQLRGQKITYVTASGAKVLVGIRPLPTL